MYMHQREKIELEDPGVDGRIILQLIFKKQEEDTYWTDMDQDRDRWLLLLNVVMKLWVP
jgi:hypothetical protein